MKKIYAFSLAMLLVSSIALLNGCGSVVEEPQEEQSEMAAMSAAAGIRKIVVFEKGVPQSAQVTVVKGQGATVIKTLKSINAQVVTLPDQARVTLLGQPGVLRIDDDIVVSALPAKPDKPGKPGGGGDDETQPPQQLPWGVDRIDADLALAAGQTGSGVKVAVIDTGIDSSHPDLAVAGGINTINPRKSPKDDNGHGTHCAGIIAGLNNEIGVVGVAPEATLYAVKALDRRGSGYLSDIIEGIEWSVNNGAQVISMSLGTNTHVQSFQDAVAAAYAAGVTLVAAAGNDYGTAVDYPGAYPEVIAVSATDSGDNLAAFSDVGIEVELAAPGVDILSTYKDGKYAIGSGTSMACPHVAGTAALIIGAGLASTPDEVRSLLAATADDLGAAERDDLFGQGLVDAEEAATGIQSNP